MSMAVLTIVLMAPVAFVSSVGRGYLLPVGWTVLTLALANLSIALGWGDWFPWAVPLLLSRTLIAGAEPVGLHGFLVVLVAFLLGTAATLAWWRGADQTR
jgi:ABC-2 type transport system permease protein